MIVQCLEDCKDKLCHPLCLDQCAKLGRQLINIDETAYAQSDQKNKINPRVRWFKGLKALPDSGSTQAADIRSGKMFLNQSNSKTSKNDIIIRYSFAL